MKMKFTPEAEDVLFAAVAEAKRRGHIVMMPEHLFAVLLKRPKIQELFQALKISLEHLMYRNGIFLSLSSQAPSFAYLRILEQAGQISKLNDEDHISSENIFLALLAEENSESSKLLAEFRVEKYRVLAFFDEGCLIAGGDAS